MAITHSTPTPPSSSPPPGLEPHNPVRDDSKLAPTEDLDRMPDGAPHRVIGMTAFFAVTFALLFAFMLLVGTWWTRIGVVLVAAIAVPLVIGSLRKKSERERDRSHPSR